MFSPKQPPRHLLIIRMLPITYVAMLPYAIRALRLSYPDLKITVATRRELSPLFEGLDVNIFPLEKKHHGIFAAYRSVSRLKAKGVDYLADLNFVPYSMRISFIAWIRGIKVRYLHKQKVARWLRMGYSPDDAVSMNHIVVQYCDAFRRLGLMVENPTTDPIFPSRVNPYGQKHGTWIGFAPFASSAGKIYPEPQRTQVVELLSAKYDRVFIHGGDGAERDFASAMASRFENVTAVRESFDLKSELDLIAWEDCIVAMDSMAAHLASLVGTSVVSVWGATHPQFGCTGYGNDPEGVLQVDMRCRPCSAHTPTVCKSGDYRCMNSVTPQMIVEKVEYMLGKKQQ